MVSYSSYALYLLGSLLLTWNSLLSLKNNQNHDGKRRLLDRYRYIQFVLYYMIGKRLLLDNSRKREEIFV